MAFTFQKAKLTTTSWDWTEEGAFKKFVKGKFLKFTKKNLASTKRVVLLISDDPEDFSDCTYITLTEGLSNSVREALKKTGVTHAKVISALLNLQIQSNEQGRYFLFAPAGDGEALAAIAVDELKAVNFETLASF